MLAACAVVTLPASAWSGEQRPVDHVALVTGGPLLQWDQAAPSPSEIARYEFRLYADGVLVPLTDVRCEGRLAGVFQCSGRMPVLTGRRHALQLSARRDSLEGSKSSALVVDLDARQAATTAVTSSRTDGEPTRTTCFSGGDAPCFRAANVASLHGRVTAATVSPDGRLWMVEDGKHVRIVAAGGLVAEPAVSVRSGQQRIVGISADPAFATSRHVFVALLDELESGQGEVTLARYREVGGRLAQGAVVVSGLEVAASSYDPRFLQDPQGRLYLALPGGDAAGGRRLPHAGELLRYTADGAIPWESGQNSPALAPALAFPTAVAGDPLDGRVWLAGRDAGGAQLLAVSTNERTPGAPAAASRVAVSPDRALAGAVGLGIVHDAADAAKRFLLSVSGDGVVERQLLDGGRAGNAQRLDFPYGTPMMLAASGSTIYLIAARPNPGDPGTDVYLLTPAP